MTDHDHEYNHPQHDVSVKSGRPREDEPGAAGHPTPGSGHDDGETVTVADGPSVEKVDGVPGATPSRSTRDTP